MMLLTSVSSAAAARAPAAGAAVTAVRLAVRYAPPTLALEYRTGGGGGGGGGGGDPSLLEASLAEEVAAGADAGGLLEALCRRYPSYFNGAVVSLPQVRAGARPAGGPLPLGWQRAPL